MKTVVGLLALSTLLLAGSSAHAQDQPSNIVLVFMDNFAPVEGFCTEVN